MNTIIQDKIEQDEIKQAQTLHDLAMDTAEAATLACWQSVSKSRELFRQAFLYERDAANRLAGNFTLEPSRSILHRSAAALALECGEWRAAEQLIGAALAGNPPDEIAEELRSLLQQVYSMRVQVSFA